MVRFKLIIVITAIWLAVLLSGCVEEKKIAEPTNITPTITAIATQSVTPLPEVISTDNMILVKLDGVIGFIPNIQTVKEGDEIVWENFDPVNVILVSNERIFNSTLLAYNQQYRYIFSNPGTYNFSIKNTNLTGIIIVESAIAETSVNQTPAPSVTTLVEFPSNALYVTARMKKLSDWSTGNEIKYGLDALKVNVMNQMNMPLTIKAQIMTGGRILEEKNFTLEKIDSIIEYSNEKNHFINNTEVNLRLLIQGYAPIEYKFIEVDQLN